MNLRWLLKVQNKSEEKENLEYVEPEPTKKLSENKSKKKIVLPVIKGNLTKTKPDIEESHYFSSIQTNSQKKSVRMIYSKTFIDDPSNLRLAINIY